MNTKPDLADLEDPIPFAPEEAHGAFRSLGECEARWRARRQRPPAAPAAAVRTLPHSVEAEEFLLSACMLDGGDVLAKCLRGGITERSFYDARHGVIFRTLLDLMSSGKPTGVEVVAEELKARRQLEEVGGYAGLARVSQHLPTTARAAYFVEKVREQALLRDLIREASAAVEDAYGFSGGEIDEFCARQESRLLGVARARIGVGRASRGALPQLMAWGDLVGATPRPEPPQLVGGLIHRGSKVMLGGGSKSFKTWCLLHMALAIATGRPWWGLKTTAARVLFVNFELQPWSFEGRVRDICAAMATPLDDAALRANFVSWHLRGYASDLAELIPQFLANTLHRADGSGEGSKFDVIILDPIYKCLGERDENANGEVAGLLNEVEALAVRSDAAVVFGHHFSKGNQAAKDSRDRVSGAGAWTRDPDTVITLTPHEEEDCFTAEFVLRDLKPRAPMVVRWAHPCMMADGKLDPSALRQPGRPTEHTVEALVDILRSEGAVNIAGGLTCSKLESLAKQRKDMSKTTFFRKLEEAVKSGRIERGGTFYFVSEGVTA